MGWGTPAPRPHPPGSDTGRDRVSRPGPYPGLHAEREFDLRTAPASRRAPRGAVGSGARDPVIDVGGNVLTARMLRTDGAFGDVFRIVKGVPTPDLEFRRGDTDASGSIDIADAILLCGEDPTADLLECVAGSGCP